MLEDIVFRSRNKAFGAYALRKQYDRTLLLSFLTTAGLLVALLLLAGWSSAPKPPSKAIIDDGGILYDDGGMPEDPEPTPPALPSQGSAGAMAPPELTVPQIVDNDQVPVDTPPITQGLPGSTGDPNNNGTGNGGTGNDPGEPGQYGEPCLDCHGTATPAVPEPVVDHMALKPHELDLKPEVANMADFQRSLVFPIELQSIGLNGKVVLKVVMDKEGKVESWVVKSSTHKLFTQEVERKIRILRMSPAIYKGKPIRYWMMVPVVFNLNK